MSAMAFKVFLSHSAEAEERPIVWRLQTLAASHGIEVYVPQRSGRAAVVPAAVRNAIDRADCILAIITHRISSAVENELNYALGRGKIIIPIVKTGITDAALLRSFPRVFKYSSWENPGKVETEVIEFLRQKKLSKEAQMAIAALVAIGLGLLVLSSAAKE